MDAVVRVLEADPDLARAVPGEQRQAAVDALVARVYQIASGAWEVGIPAPDRGALGLLVLDGVLGLRTSVEGRSTLELVGTGDVLQPWVQLGAETTVPPAAGWRIFEPSRVALLDRRFAETAVGWPEVMSALMYRLVLRSRRLCYQLAVNTSPRVEERVLFSLWALADRWGRVSDDGVVLKLNLTHEHIAELVGVLRPSVSAALNRLREDQLLGYTRGEFVLPPEPPHAVRDLKRQVALEP